MQFRLSCDICFNYSYLSHAIRVELRFNFDFGLVVSFAFSLPLSFAALSVGQTDQLLFFTHTWGEGNSQALSKHT